MTSPVMITYFEAKMYKMFGYTVCRLVYGVQQKKGNIIAVAQPVYYNHPVLSVDNFRTLSVCHKAEQAL